MKVLLEVQDAARRLSLSSDSVRALERAGQLPTVARTPRGLRLFDPVVVNRMAERRRAHKQAATGER
jgi:DNA-binding transcriptional MerR regulator